MIFRNRALTRVGAAALLASGVFTALGVPARAAGTETDLSLDVVGTRVAAGTAGKVAFAKVTNNGKNTPSALSINADLSKLDTNKAVPVPAMSDCDLDVAGWTCDVPAELVPGPGETTEIPVVLFKQDDIEGTYKASVTFTITSTDDTDASNNSRTATIELTDESGPDLLVLAGDVKQAVKVGEGGELSIVGDLHAGQTGMLQYFVVNQGDQATAGLTVTVKLPKGVTFPEVEPDCEYDAAKTEAVCTYRQLPLVPADEDTGGNDDVISGGDFFHLLSVGADVKAGSLTGGSVTVEPIVAKSALRGTAREATKLPENMTGIRATDVDASDNTDGYAVVVAAKGGSGGGDGGSLPVTGPQAGLIGGIGGAVLLAGGAMFLAARRRRVVLVTPSDEKSTV
ncbi:LPXTG cell wall anchor domain-containing protein [Micromonospora inyonensis]|uniref:LPXTG-motif cell wall anchor domain-containing protein n=1 Tax=Micromonospora inyonensis TaxID=47866 RepID=A0A1C6RI27_9ACTN|nr:LPXTG cell wall anchor domain-containing protein [Micromonospora inyonensis]SCL16765.1 LPXTG-motif cell wall anchor domain-containing protein [Micromonospora inyonensis]